MSDDEKYEEEFSENESSIADENMDEESIVDENIVDIIDDEVEEPVDEIVESDNEDEYVGGGDGDEVGDNDEVTEKNQKTLETTSQVDSDEDDDEEDDPFYLQKFNSEINHNYLVDAHPECVSNNYDEIKSLTTIIRDTNNNIIDPLHRTIPYLTKYEKTRILGYRAKQINSGAKVFIKVPENMIDGYLVAEIELKLKKIPFIIRRPIPGGSCEYWNLKDLEVIGF